MHVLSIFSTNIMISTLIIVILNSLTVLTTESSVSLILIALSRKCGLLLFSCFFFGMTEFQTLSVTKTIENEVKWYLSLEMGTSLLQLVH